MLCVILSLSGPLPGRKNILERALEHVLADDSFKINATQTIQVRKQAESLLQWCVKGGNSDIIEDFTRTLMKSLKEILTSARKPSFAYNTEKIWKGFFLLRSSPSFVDKWTNFLRTTNEPAKPVLFQHLTDLIFRDCLNEHFKVLHLNDQESSAELTNAEKGVLRYVAGYVCRQLRKKLERESHKYKEEMVLCLMELIKGQDSEEHGTDEEWTDLIDRGGLWHIKGTTYQFFCAMEYVVREVLTILVKPSSRSKQEIVEKVTSDEDVQFYWLIVTADFEIDDPMIHEILLNKIVELFLTIRGFSLASGWLEKYKQCTKKPTQRTKSLRRELHDAT